jgi:hypothetical protein
VPSDTYSVAALGCGSALVGRTDYCELPEQIVRTIPAIGGTKNPRVEQILDLQPDLVIANQEENSKGDLERLAAAGVKVFVCFPKRVADGLGHLAKLARIFRVEGDHSVRDLVRRGYEALREAEVRRGHSGAGPFSRADGGGAGTAPLSVFCPIWMDPLMTIHADTFISDMLRVAGADNVFADRARRYPLAADLGRGAALPAERVGDRDTRYPRVTLDEVVARAPFLVLLPDEPHPFSEADARVFEALPIPAARLGNVVRTEGKDLSWYGARSVEGIGRVVAQVKAAQARFQGDVSSVESREKSA